MLKMLMLQKRVHHRPLCETCEGTSADRNRSCYLGTQWRSYVHTSILCCRSCPVSFGFRMRLPTLSADPSGLLLELQDSGSPDLDIRPRRPRPTSFKSSDRRSLLRYMGLRKLPFQDTPGYSLPYAALHLFGKDAFFQPYLPLQQVDMLYAKTWLTGTTNQIVTQQKDCKYDLLVNVSCPILSVPQRRRN